MVVGALALTLVVQAASVRDDLGSAQDLVANMQSFTMTGDVDGLQSAAADVTQRVTHANETVQSPLWQAGSVIPAVGANLRAITELAAAVETLTSEALPPGKTLLSQLSIDKIGLADGGIDLEPFERSQPSIPLVAAAFSEARAQTDAIEDADLLPPVADSVAKVRTFLDDASKLLDVAQEYLPTMLDIAGSTSPKNYLIVFQNNAEVRATGGNPAASIVAHVDNGRVQILEEANSIMFDAAGAQGQPFLDLPAETTDLYPSTFTLFSQDFTMTPDFPTTAALFRALWKQSDGSTFDGIISIDPVVLSYMLAVTGPVNFGDLQLTADNAVQVLLSDSYERFPEGADSDAFFSAITHGFFGYLTTTRWDPAQMLAALQKATEEQRLLMNFSDASAQALAVELHLDGSLGAAADGTAPVQVGTYLNDYSVGKLEYHLRQSVDATCDAQARTITITTTLSNEIPLSIRSRYTLGARNARFDLPPTTMMIDVLFFAPPGAEILATDPSVGDVGSLDRAGRQNDNSAVSRLIAIPQGATRTVSTTIRLPGVPLGPLALRHSPLTSPTAVTVNGGCDALFAPAEAATATG